MKFIAYASLAGAAVALPQSGKPNNGTGRACDAQTSAMVAQLSKGIQSNIMIQMQELQGVKAIQSLEMTNSATSAINFTANQQTLLKIQYSGVEIRAANQKIAAALKSPSEQGLATVAMAQVLEINQVKSLQGTGANDQKTLEMLVKEVEDGTKQNMMNLMAARSQCA